MLSVFNQSEWFFAASLGKFYSLYSASFFWREKLPWSLELNVDHSSRRGVAPLVPSESSCGGEKCWRYFRWFEWAVKHGCGKDPVLSTVPLYKWMPHWLRDLLSALCTSATRLGSVLLSFGTRVSLSLQMSHFSTWAGSSQHGCAKLP